MLHAGRGQGPGPGVPVDTGILAISDAEVCARSIPGEQGYPIGGLGPSISGKVRNDVCESSLVWPPDDVHNVDKLFALT